MESQLLTVITNLLWFVAEFQQGPSSVALSFGCRPETSVNSQQAAMQHVSATYTIVPFPLAIPVG